MEDNRELRRQWQEKAMWIAGSTIVLSFLGYYILQRASFPRIFWFSIYTLFFAWGSWLALTKPDAKIIQDRMYLFKWLQSKPTVLMISEITSIKRHSEFPIWRVPPLRFYLKNGSTITFSTGASESRMKRIIKFIETETALRIINL